MDRDPPGFGIGVARSRVRRSLPTCEVPNPSEQIWSHCRRSQAHRENGRPPPCFQPPNHGGFPMGLIVDKPQRWMSGVSMAGCFLKLKMKEKTTISVKKSVKWSCLRGVCVVVFEFVEFFLMQRVQEPCPRNVGTRIEKTHVQCIHF